MEAKNYTLRDYLNKSRDIIVPIYQCGYSWEDKNMEVFINDIYNNDKYYIGNIMTLPTKEKNVELIDDQQRIISIFLILCSIKNIYKVGYDFLFLAKARICWNIKKCTSYGENLKSLMGIYVLLVVMK